MAVGEQQDRVLRMIAQGHSDAEIACKINRSLSAVKFHREALFRKYKARNRTHLAYLFLTGKLRAQRH